MYFFNRGQTSTHRRLDKWSPSAFGQIVDLCLTNLLNDVEERVFAVLNCKHSGPVGVTLVATVACEFTVGQVRKCKVIAISIYKAELDKHCV